MTEATALDRVDAERIESRAGSAYGWVMVVVAALAMVATLPGRTHGLGMITERLLDDPAFGLTRTSYGQLNLWATLIGSLFCLGIGSCIDRFGTRGTLAVVMFALGAVVLWMTRTTSLTVLFVAIMLTRGFGQSALSVVSIAIVGKWFQKNVSVPMAIYSVLMALGFMTIAVVGQDHSQVDWRRFWSVIGWSVVGLAAVFTLVARDPAVPPNEEEGADSKRETEPVNFTHAEAIRTPMFWVCAFGISLYGMITAGISLFNESVLHDRGFPTSVYYESLKWGFLVGVAAKLFAGVVGMYLPVSRLLSISLVVLAGSLVWLTQLETYADVIVYVIVYGIAGGMLTVLFFSTWPDLYGRAHLGKIQGSAQMMTVIASAFGPLAFGWTRDATGSYEPLVWVLVACSAATAVVAWLTPLPRKDLMPAGET